MSSGETAQLWDAETGQRLSILTGRDEMKRPSWSPDGKLAALTNSDGSVRIWDPYTGVEVYHFPVYVPYFVIWSPSDDRVFATGQDTNLISQFKFSPAIRSIPVKPGFHVADWAPDGHQFGMSNNLDGTVVIYDAETLQEVMSLDGGEESGGIKWSPSGDRILTIDRYGTIRIWNASTGELLLDIGDQERIESGSWSPDGNKIVTSGDQIILWEAETGEEIWNLVMPDVGAATWSPDGLRLATSGWSNGGKILDAGSGEILTSLVPGDPWNFIIAVWSNDGKKIVISTPKTGWIFDSTTGAQLVEFPSGFSSFIENVNWAPGDKRIFATGMDGTFRVFDAASGNQLFFYDFGDAVAGCLSPDGSEMLMLSRDNRISIYPAWLTKEDLIDYAKNCCVLRELTEDEREIFGLSSR
jgi:WD40 repeat protein